jgi:hypothetical protein
MDSPPVPLGTAAVIGGILVVAGWLALRYWTGVTPAYSFVFAGGLLVLVGSIASNTQADALLLVTVGALVWAALPHGVAEDDTLGPSAGRPTLVAVGDSYMSGCS